MNSKKLMGVAAVAITATLFFGVLMTVLIASSKREAKSIPTAKLPPLSSPAIPVMAPLPEPFVGPLEDDRVPWNNRPRYMEKLLGEIADKINPKRDPDAFEPR